MAIEECILYLNLFLMHLVGTTRVKKKNVLIFHLGEKNSFIMSVHKFEIMMVKPIFLGIQNLTDSLVDNGISLENWSNRKGYQIPESFLRAMGQNVSSGQYDDIFRPVFDSWRQEIDRTVNGMRKDCKLQKVQMCF